MMSANKTTGVHLLTRNKLVLNCLSWLLPLSLSGGGDLLCFEWLGATWYAFRIVVVVGGVLACVDIASSRRSIPFWLWSWIATAIIWLAWALINRDSTMDKALWQKGIFYLLIGFASLLTIYHLSSQGKQSRMVAATAMGLAMNVIIAALQMSTSLRPDSAFTQELVAYSSEHYVRFVPTGLFGNPNHFAMYVCAQLLLIYSFRRYIAFASRMALYALSVLLIILTQSRIGEIALLILAVFIAIENRRWLVIQSTRLSGKILIGLCFVGAIVLSHTWINTRERALEIERSNNTLKHVKEASEGSRTALLKCGYEMLTESGYRGVGAGQFPRVVREKGCNTQTGGMVDPHCGIAEIAAESGVVVAILWIIALVICVVQSFRTGLVLQSLAWLLVLGVLQFANSTFLSTPVAWCLIAWPIMAHFEREK